MVCFLFKVHELRKRSFICIPQVSNLSHLCPLPFNFAHALPRERVGFWLFEWGCNKVPCCCERTANVLARLRGCAGSPEPLLVAYATIHKFACRGPYVTILRVHSEDFDNIARMNSMIWVFFYEHMLFARFAVRRLWYILSSVNKQVNAHLKCGLFERHTTYYLVHTEIEFLTLMNDTSIATIICRRLSKATVEERNCVE